MLNGRFLHLKLFSMVGTSSKVYNRPLGATSKNIPLRENSSSKRKLDIFRGEHFNIIYARVFQYFMLRIRIHTIEFFHRVKITTV